MGEIMELTKGENMIHDKLIKIQGTLKAPKGQFNAFGKYKYRSCEDIVEAVKPLCVSEGVVLTISDEIVMLGTRYYVQATAQVSDGKETISVKGFAREAEIKKGMDESQITGAASSYARKYALNGLFCIDDTKDADSDEKHEVVSQFINDKQKGTLLDMVTDSGANLSKLVAFFKIAELEQLPSERYNEAVTMLTEFKSRKKDK